MVADGDAGACVGVEGEVLGVGADDGAGADEAMGTDGGVVEDLGVCFDTGGGADIDLSGNNGKGADFDILGNGAGGFDDGGGVDHGWDGEVAGQKYCYVVGAGSIKEGIIWGEIFCSSGIGNVGRFPRRGVYDHEEHNGAHHTSCGVCTWSVGSGGRVWSGGGSDVDE